MIRKKLYDWQVIERWKPHGPNKLDILQIIFDRNLIAYDTDTGEPINIEHEKELLEQRKSDDEINTIRDWFGDRDIAGAFFYLDDLEAFERTHSEIFDLLAPPAIQENDLSLLDQGEGENIEAAQNNAANFFRKENGNYWHIGFNGEEARITHIEGLQFIACLLANKGRSISCRELYQAVGGMEPGNTHSEGAVIDQGLNIGYGKQEISDKEAKDNYLKKYRELHSDLENIESDMERQEIETEMDHIMNCLKGKSFADPDKKKAQANVKKRLDTAYDSIRDANMDELAKHLQDNIKPDGKYGLLYSSANTWEIE